ncbi:MAG: tRNA (adenosine(37)-N6)-threonylcarbamoyltransferase complex dimerization subunit type 1 TsaB [Bacteroidales bacterium]
MALILNIETTAEVCSVVLSKDGEVLQHREDREGRSHAKQLSVFIKEIMEEVSIVASDLDAVSISEGPGSYTGLRIGVSTAKGLCYGASLFLISVPTLQALTQGLLNQKHQIKGSIKDDDILVPMIDARRMEVYTAMFNSRNEYLKEAEPVILDENSFKDILEKQRVIFFGNGAEKAKKVIHHQNACFVNSVDFSALHMISLSEQKFKNRIFEDIAYFEPFYLKDFQTTTPRNKIL